jgi:hypothetical protein
MKKEKFGFYIRLIGLINIFLWGFFVFASFLFIFGGSQSTGDFIPWWIKMNFQHHNFLWMLIPNICSLVLLRDIFFLYLDNKKEEDMRKGRV